MFYQIGRGEPTLVSAELVLAPSGGTDARDHEK